MTAHDERAKQQHYEQKSAGYSASGRRSERMLKLVGGPGLRVLDVACGPGHIGKLLRERGNRVVGAEISESAASEARRVLDEVHVFDIEADWPLELAEATFDVVLLGEVLEHVFDPVSVLRQAHRVLGPQGRVVVTTPNFLVWIARLQVLFGRFRYQKYGIFDFGHIRFFTYAYLKQVLKEAGFDLKTEHHVHHPARLEPLLKGWPNLFALNFVVEARKTAERA
jgi:2-polyprenyl-3-methyl-5-hydroxy-6-metoxy-1,4-benzoquinol methylase